MNDYPGRVRVVVDEDDGDSQLGLIGAFRSRHHSPDATAAIAYEAEALDPLDAAATAALTGASGGTVVTHAALSTDWTPVLGTDIGGTTPLTHVGTYRVWVRARSPHGSDVSVRLLWDVGDLTLPAENAPRTIPGESSLFNLDLGEVRLNPAPVGTHHWRGVIQAKGALGNEDVSIDKVWLVPVDEGYAVLRAPITADQGLAGFAARDEFNQTAGPLAGKTMSAGGTWGGSGDTDDFAIDAVGHTAQRAAASDAGDYLGRAALAGASDYTAIAAQVDFKTDTVTDQELGLVARYDVIPGNDRFVQCTVNPQLGAVSLRTVISFTPLFDFLGDTDFPVVANAWYTLRLLVADSGHWAVWGGPRSDNPPLLMAGHDTDLATGGGFATGQVGFYDAYTGGGVVTRSYDNFAAWVPQLDAVLYANRSAQLHTDGAYREAANGAAWGPTQPPAGDLSRLPPSGLEGRPVELFVKASRGDFGQVPDTGIDDISCQVFYRPCWLFISDA